MIELPVIDAQSAEDASSAGKPRQRFWRSLSQLRKHPEFQELAQHEFMPGVTEESGGASRRQFLQLMGASMAMAGLTACRRPVEKILPYTRKPEEVIPGIPLYYATAMPFRGSVRPLLVESHEGRPTKVEGNPDHPSSTGATGVFEQASVLTLYDPDRSRAVLRDGVEASWRDFVDFVQQFRQGAEAKRVVVLSEDTSSPTLLALREELRRQFSQLRWITYAAEGDDPVKLGMQQAFGRPLRPLYRLSEAEVIVSLDADFLGTTERNFVSITHEFALSRQLDTPEDTMSRLYVVESAYSTTGGTADHRLPLRSSDIPAFAAALAARLGVGGGAAASRFEDHPYVVAMAEDLQAAGSRGVVMAGESQPPEVHALCAAINDRLGSTGTVMVLLDTGEASVTPQDEALAELVQDMNAGAVDALIFLDTNPVYSAPADLDFVSALKKVRETIHLGLYVDETAQASRWHLPRAHYLEAWGDGRAYDGTLSVVQPLIAPLYEEAHSDVELVNLLASGRDQSGYDLVRATWRGFISGNFEQGWRKVLHDGYLENSAFPAVTASVTGAPSGEFPVVEEDALEVVFRLDPTVLDGSFANNAWCQELPDPTTKVVWDNVAVMSPRTAEALGVDAEYSKGKYHCDLIELQVGAQRVVLPVWVQPGFADNSIGVTLGYGRSIRSPRPHRESPFWDLDAYTDVYARGPLANEVGQNVAPLRPALATNVVVGAEVSRLGETYMVSTTQDHGALDLEARPLLRVGTYDEYKANPNFVKEYEEPTPKEPFEEYPTLWEERHPSDEPPYRDQPYYENQWGMVIDLNTCTGCNACVIACQAENNVPVVGKVEVARGREMHWLRIDRYFISEGDGDYGDIPSNPQMIFGAVPCMHCENAPCESVCPVAATVHSADGINEMVYNRCIGTRYCSNNCPYKVRCYNFFNWTKTMPPEVMMVQNPDVTVRFRGVMEKCTFCVQRVRQGQRRANIENRPLRDGEVQTACQQACPAGAIVFGDLANPDSAVSKRVGNPRAYKMLAQLNTKPRVSYLGKVRNLNPRLAELEAYEV